MSENIKGLDRNDLSLSKQVQKAIVVSGEETIAGINRQDLQLSKEVIKVQIIGGVPGIDELTRETINTKVLDGRDFDLWQIRFGGTKVITDTVLHSTKGIKLTASGGSAAIRNNSIRRFMIKDRKYITVFVYVENRENIDTLYFYLAEDLNYTNYASYQFGPNTLVEGWNELRIDLTKPNEQEGIIPDSVGSIQMLIGPKGDAPLSVTFDSIFTTESSKKASVIFTFDDGWTNQYDTIFPLMLERGFKGCMAVVSNFLGVEQDFMQPDNAKEMHSFGWDIFNHTANHLNLTTLTSEQVAQEVEDCATWLINNGMPEAARILAYPYGGHNEMVVDTLTGSLIYARTLVEGIEPSYPLERLKGKTRNVLNFPLATLKGYVDEAVKLNSTVVFCLHKVGPVPDEFETTLLTDTFTGLLDYVYSLKNSLEVITLTEWLKTNY